MAWAQRTVAYHVSSLWASLPLAPWPARWEVQETEQRHVYALVLSRQARREVRVGREVETRGAALVLQDVRADGASELVGLVEVRPGFGGVSGACRRAFELALAHLVMES